MGLFDEHETLRVAIDSALEGRLGAVTYDDASSPTIGRIVLGCYAFFSGDALNQQRRDRDRHAPGLRRLGLARAIAAPMILGCLRRGLRPEWSASNPVSKRLARSLGYRPAALCDIVFYG